MIKTSKLLSQLEYIGTQRDEEIELAKVALLLGALDHPNADLASYKKYLTTLEQEAAGSGERIGSLRGQVTFLNQLIYETHGFKGEIHDYENPANANILEVIDKKTGLPVSIGILYIHAARSASYNVTGLAFPGHFLLRLTDGADRIIIDPFHEGKSLDAGHLRNLLKQFIGVDAELTPKYYAPVGNREILLRLQNNIKTRALKNNDIDRATQILERMTLFAPLVAPIWQELGVLSAQIGKLKQAVTALDNFLGLQPSGDERKIAVSLLKKIRSRLN